MHCFERVRRIYPAAKFVHVVRDAIASFHRRRRSDFAVVSHWYYATLTGIMYRPGSARMSIVRPRLAIARRC